MGLVWGAFYLLTRRNLWPLILGHYFTDAFGVISLFLVKGSLIGAGWPLAAYRPSGQPHPR